MRGTQDHRTLRRPYGIWLIAFAAVSVAACGPGEHGAASAGALTGAVVEALKAGDASAFERLIVPPEVFPEGCLDEPRRGGLATHARRAPEVFAACRVYPWGEVAPSDEDPPRVDEPLPGCPGDIAAGELARHYHAGARAIYLDYGIVRIGTRYYLAGEFRCMEDSGG